MIQRLKKSVGYLIGLTVIGHIISFLRESIFSYYYGTSCQADAYVMASQIPITLFAVVTASINTVVLPIYSSKKEKEGQDFADQFMKSFIVVFEVVGLTLTLLSLLFARQIVLIFAPAFSGDLLELTVRYVSLLFPTILLSILINILTVRYNVQKNFSYPQYMGLFQNLAVIGMMVAFASSMSTDAAVIGTIIGLALNTFFLAVPCWQVFRKRFEIKELWKDITHVLFRVIPVACGVGIAEVNCIVDKAIASGLDTGSITGLNYANKLTVVFSALIVTALSTVCFQQFSNLYAKELFKERFRELLKYLLILVYILLPVTCGALILKRELIIVAFARGAFGLESVNLTSSVFFYYSIGILPIAIREVLSKYYFSSGNTKTPMINSAIGIAINIVLNFVLSKYMGASGLALATTISYVAVCVLLFVSILKSEKGNGYYYEFVKDCIPSFLGSLIMTILLFIVNRTLSDTHALVVLVACTLVGMLSYMIFCYFFARKQMKCVIGTLFGKV